MPASRVDKFDLQPGRVLAGRYRIERFIGSGWEGEVYRVVEERTGVTRAAKLFFPQRNINDKAVKLYARKLDKLKRVQAIIQYHHSETVRIRGVSVTALFSDFVEGELLNTFVGRHPGKRLHYFQALVLLYTLTHAIEQIHAAGEYHGDLHPGNVLVQPVGVGFDVQLVDFYHHGSTSRDTKRYDVVDLVHLLYESLGGKKHYASQPECVKAICKGLRRDLIVKKFPTATKLREYLETFDWEKP